VAAEQRRRDRGNSDGGAGKGDAQQCTALGASMWPREDARKVTGRGGSAAGRARRRLRELGLRRSWGSA
jgi:hypothetical protein